MKRKQPVSTTPAKTVGYIRVSDEDQVKSGLGLDSQKDIIRYFAKQGKCPPLEEPIEHDAGFSGKRQAKLSQREGLRNAVNRLGPGDVLLVTKTDRFARNQMEALVIEEKLREKGVKLLSAAGEGTDGDEKDPSTFLIRGLFRLLSEWESINIGSRISTVFARKRGLNEFCGGKIPFGYDAIENGKIRQGRDGRETKIRILQVNPAEQAVISEIWTLADKGLSERMIAASLNSRKVQTKTGGAWHKTTIRRLIETREPKQPGPDDTTRVTEAHTPDDALP